MFQEHIARHTASHLRGHIKAYLAEISAEYTGDLTTTLVVPKRIEISSAVGGMIQEFDKILPQYGIDVLGKSLSADDASLWSYEYPGQINGLVHGGSRETVDLSISRHARAVEHFINQHRFMHKYQDPSGNFSIVEFIFANTEFSGAENISTEDAQIWLAGFSTNVSWFTSENGPDDHV